MADDTTPRPADEDTPDPRGAEQLRARIRAAVAKAAALMPPTTRP